MSSERRDEKQQELPNKPSDEPTDESGHNLKLHNRGHHNFKEFDADKLRKPHTVAFSPALRRAGLQDVPGGNAGGLLRNDGRPEAPRGPNGENSSSSQH